MSVQIRELIIKTEVRDDTARSTPGGRVGRDGRTPPAEQAVTADDLERLMNDRAER